MHGYRRPLRALALVITAAVCGSAPPASAQQATDGAKVKAVLVGVAQYAQLDPRQALPRAAADAEGMRAVLVERLKVPAGNIATLSERPTRDAIRRAWRSHIASLAPGDVSIFYFSGHGAEQDKEPFLLPFDYRPQRAIGYSGVALLDLINELRAKGRKNLGIFIVDACRTEVGQAAGGKFIESGDGFAPVRAAAGTFVFYAAAPNQIALHDLGKGDTNAYSVYTRLLLSLIEDPSRGLHEIAKDLRWETYQLALTRRTADGVPKPHIQVPAYFDEVLQRRNILGALLPTLQARPRASSGQAPGALGGDKSLWVCRSCPEMIEVPLPVEPVALRSETGTGAADGRDAITLSRRYAIGKYEVTRDEWRACQDDGRCRILDGGIIEGDRRPISGVTFDDAKAFIAWLNETSGQTGFRLPTEAEWEHAARGGSSSAYGPATEQRHLCDYANGADASLRSLLWTNAACNDGKARGVASAGSYRPNLFGVHDMQGNVWEWVDACHGDACARRIAKGGSWRSGPEALRIAAFQAFAPDSGRATLGFRVARDLD